jgi:hypothetical protein
MTRFSTSHPSTLKFYTLSTVFYWGLLMDNPGDFLILGNDFEFFWIDFLRDEIGEKREQSLNLNFAQIRDLLRTEKQGIEVKFQKIEITIFVTFNGEPEEWTVTI